MKTGSTYLVDTNIIIDFFGGEPALKDKFSEKSIVIPSVVVGELYYGAFASSQNEKKINELDEFLPDYEIISIDDDTARFYGEIKSVLRKKGTPIPENDIWICALSMQYQLSIATRDKHFDKPEKIMVEYW